MSTDLAFLSSISFGNETHSIHSKRNKPKRKASTSHKHQQVNKRQKQDSTQKDGKKRQPSEVKQRARGESKSLEDNKRSHVTNATNTSTNKMTKTADRNGNTRARRSMSTVDRDFLTAIPFSSGSISNPPTPRKKKQRGKSKESTEATRPIKQTERSRASSDADVLKGSKLLAKRLLLATKNNLPLAVFSVLPPNYGGSSTSRANVLAPIKAEVLKISKPPEHGVSWSTLLSVEQPAYDPAVLMEVQAQRSFNMNLPFCRSSVIPWVSKSDLKEDINEAFREKNTWLTTNINLSNIRSVERKLLLCALKCSKYIDVTSVAMAQAYFEKLVVKNVVDTSTHKSYGAACLYVAHKFNTPMLPSEIRASLKPIQEVIHSLFSVSRADLLCAELQVLMLLGFSLVLTPEEYVPHLKKLGATREYQDSLFSKVRTNNANPKTLFDSNFKGVP
mmetsp:Transcript_2314/g.2597  ORF Transcript_2314/g.2597 Transcript_2314/m.2597 type:complete len:447 (-) Transcript_2314:81-1421(-)